MNHEIETEDIGFAIVNFKSGAKGTILGTTTFPKTNSCFSAEVHGTEAAIHIDAVLTGEMRVFGEGLEERLGSISNSQHSIVDDVGTVGCDRPWEAAFERFQDLQTKESPT